MENRVGFGFVVLLSLIRMIKKFLCSNFISSRRLRRSCSAGDGGARFLGLVEGRFVVDGVVLDRDLAMLSQMSESASLVCGERGERAGFLRRGLELPRNLP